MKNGLFTFLTALCLGFCTLLSTHAATKVDWDQLCTNIKTFTPFKDTTSHGKMGSELGMRSDGSWGDIDYQSNSQSFWRPVKHLMRLKYLIQRDDRHSKQRLQRNMPIYLKSLNFYLDQDPKSLNWWQNEVGAPYRLGVIAIFLKEYLDQKTLNKVQIVLNRAKIYKTGQNRIWMTTNVLLNALLFENKALLKECISNFKAELKLAAANREGIQADWSFHQHGPQLQFGNYGLSYAESTNFWLNFLKNTPYEPEMAKSQIIRKYMINGLSWTCFKGYMDLGCCGRQLYHNALRTKAKYLLEIFTKAAIADPVNKEHYLAFIRGNDLNADAKAENTLTGNRYFFRSDYMIHRRKNFYTSVKMCSRRVIGTESGNGENLLAYHLADGTSFTYVKGDEYENVFPFWNWKQLPGATIPQRDEPLPLLNWHGYRNDSDFVGGVSDGVYGAAAMDFNRDGVTGRKGYFFFDDEIVYLGANFSDRANRELVTALEQNKLGVGQIVAQLDHNAIHNGSNGYLILDAPTFAYSVKARTGNWSSIYTSGKKEEERQDIFSLVIKSSKPNSNYAYITLPAMPLERFQQYIQHPQISVIANSAAIQAVQHHKLNISQVVFYAKGSLQLNGKTLTAEQPCIVMLRDGQLSAADPTQQLKKLAISYAGTSYVLPLPQGINAGQSKHVKLKP